MPDRIPTHRPARLDIRPSADARGYGKTHRRLRLLFLRRNPWCEDCLQQRGEHVPATQMDHRDGNNRNLAWENLSAKCISCHSSKTVRQDGGFGRPSEVQISALPSPLSE